MKRFKNILVIPARPFADDAALRRAASLADSNGARITVLWPLEESSDGGTGLEYFPDVIRTLEQWLENAAEQFRGRGLLIDTKVRIGRPFVEIIRHVAEAGHDMVIKTARGFEISESVIFGSTALHLLRKCPCPVWIVKPDPGEQSGVLAAVDTDTDDPQAHALNRKIMELATSLAIFEDKDIHAVHAWSDPYEDVLLASPWLDIDPVITTAREASIEDRCRSRFEAFLSEFDVVAPHMNKHFVKGIPDEVIPALAEVKNIEVIVMATVARSGIPGLLIGNTAEEVLQRVSCGVLAIKPEGFISPVLT